MEKITALQTIVSVLLFIVLTIVLIFGVIALVSTIKTDKDKLIKRNISKEEQNNDKS